MGEQISGALESVGSRTQGRGRLWIAVALYIALTLPFGFTKLNGDEAHFVTIPYLMLGGDYFLSALRSGEYGKAVHVAWDSYCLAWRFFTHPSEATPTSAAGLEKYSVTQQISTRKQPFVFTPDYFTVHRKAGKPMLAFLLNIPALAITHLLLPHDLYYYQGQYIYHPAFLVPRLSVWLMGLGGLLLVYRFVRERMGSTAALRAALIYAALPTTVIFSADLHQDVPLCFFLIPYFYFLWKRRFVWAGIFWGLAFATKNQAIFALGPIFAEGIWNFFHVQDSEPRWKPLLDAARTCAIVFFLGVIVSAPFGNPIGNLTEVIKTSDPDIESLNSAMHLYYRMPIWIGVAMLAFLALHLLEDARDSFDRMHLAWLLVPVFFYFVHNYRTYMLVPSVAILVGSYFEARSMRLVLGFLLALNAMALRSPYMTARHLVYPSLNQPGAPNTIEGIERLSGIGAIQNETSDPNSPKRPQPPARLESPR